MKKILATLVLGAFLMLGGASVAKAENDTPQNPPQESAKVCMKDATQKKNAALKTARTAYVAALEQAKTIQDKVARKVAREQARKDYKVAKKAIQTIFKTDRKACKQAPVPPPVQ